jgi:serine/threonine protein kinase/WD40 repeat protein
LLAKLPERVSQSIARHLDICPECEVAARQLDDLTDPVICSLRQALRPGEHGVDTASTSPAEADKGNSTPPGTPSPCPRVLPEKVAGYTILEELGRGGMSVVYKAWQAHPDRVVALKMILAGAHAGPERQARFLAEADAIARLVHPHIVQIHEVGQHDGLPFFSLEYVDGGSLAQPLAGAPLPPRPAAALLEKVARAVDFAHENGVVHRDLKPANILLQRNPETHEKNEKTNKEPDEKRVDPSGQRPTFGYSSSVSCVSWFIPKISDFGLAKQERSELTATGAVLGTPSYMAPEQAGGDNRTVGPAADIYSLGAILYEMLTGRPPFRGGTILETLEQVRTQEPVPPAQLQPQLPRDLGIICLKCLQKDPRNRYATALHLADDLRRFLEGRPIQARPVGTAERVWRWSRRNPGWAAMLASVALLLLVIAVGASSGVVVLREALSDSEENHRQAEGHLQRARRAERAAEEKLFEALLAQARANGLSRRAGQRFESLAVVNQATGLARRLELPPKRFLDLRNAAIAALGLPDLCLGQTGTAFDVDAEGVDFDQALEIYARTDVQGKCTVRRVSDDRLLYRLPSRNQRPAAFPALPFFTPDGRFLALARENDRALSVWKLAGSRPVRKFTEQNVIWVDYHPGGQLAAVAHTDGAISLYALNTGRRLGNLSPREAKRELRVALHPTEPLVAVASYFASVVEIRDLHTGAVLKSLDMPVGGYDAVWHPDGQTLVATDGDGYDIHFYDRTTFRRVQTLRSPGAGTCVAFNRAGDRLAAWSWRGEIQLFDVATGKLLFQTPPMRYRMPRLRFSRDGGRLACAASAGRVGIWRVGDAREYRTLLHSGPPEATAYHGAAVSPDNRLLAVYFTPDLIGLWDLETGHEIGRLPGGDANCPPLFEPGVPGGLWIAGSSGIERWPIRRQGGDPGTFRIGPPQIVARMRPKALAHNGDGRVVAACARAVGRYQPFAGGWIWPKDRPGPPLHFAKGQDIGEIVVSPDGCWAVTSAHGRAMKAWDAGTGRLVKKLSAWGSRDPRFSPDGRWLAVGGDHGRLYAVGKWKPAGPVRFNGRPEFSPDSSLLAVNTGTGIIRLIDVARGGELARLEDPHQEVSDYHGFSPDGTRLITVSNGPEKGIHVWDLRALRRRLKELDLDWEAPAYPPATASARRPLRIEVVP